MAVVPNGEMDAPRIEEWGSDEPASPPVEAPKIVPLAAADPSDDTTAREPENSITGKGSSEKVTFGRPRKEVDLQLLALLAEAGASVEEVAAMLTRSGADIDPRTIKRRLKEPHYHQAWQNGVNVGKAKLRLQMVKQSRLMNSAGVQMAIHLSKHWLGMTEKAALETGNPIIVKISGRDAEL